MMNRSQYIDVIVMKTYRDEIVDKAKVIVNGISSGVFAFCSIFFRFFLIVFDAIDSLLITCIQVARVARRLSGIYFTLKINK